MQTKDGAKKMLERDPDYYKKLGAKGAKSRKNPYHHFKQLQEENPELLKSISTKAGKSKKP